MFKTRTVTAEIFSTIIVITPAVYARHRWESAPSNVACVCRLLEMGSQSFFGYNPLSFMNCRMAMVRVSRGLQARKTTRRVSLAQGFRPYSSLHSLFTRWMQNWLAASSIVVVIPELVEDKWYEYFLHNQSGRLLEWGCIPAAMNASSR